MHLNSSIARYCASLTFLLYTSTNSIAADPQIAIQESIDRARSGSGNTIRFTFAANKSLGVSSQRLRSSISQMDALTRIADYGPGADTDGAAYPADISCTGVKFELGGGGVQEPDGLPDIFASGVPGYDWKAFTDVVKADVYVVSSITCGGVTDAIGCAPVGGKPRVVTAAFGGLDGSTILHEELHTRGIGHSNGDGPCPKDYRSSRESAWRRIMYCQANEFAKGLIEKECRALGGTPVNVDTPLVAGGDGTNDAALEPNPQSAISSKLRDVLKSPRLEGNVLNPEIANLNQDDLKLVQRVISTGSPIDLLQGAIVVLGERGDISDAYLLKSFVFNSALPSSNLIPPAKFTALSAMGKIGGRLQSPTILAEILSATDPARAEQAVGPALAEAFRLHATLALGEGKETAQPLIRGLQKKEESLRTGASVDIRSLNPGTDAAIINQIQKSSPISPNWLSKSLEISNQPRQ